MMRYIEAFPSKQMYPYLSSVERKVAESYHNIDRRRWLVWSKWLFFITFPGQLMVSLSRKSNENKSFYPNQIAPSIYIIIELCYYSLAQWEMKIHRLWGKSFNISHWPRSHLTNGILQQIEDLLKSKTRIRMVWLICLTLGTIDGVLEKY